ncbi:hypothetical protein RUM43_007063 [Polyplax serrata]|uniref:PBZ-type domain-containing protein n=1 Tax=Polyplax serrata TaxID=468196 RepID=A0AAN8S8H9_POLSC
MCYALRCTDRRVARRHGELSCTSDGKIILTALSSNPCFVIKNGKPPKIHLRKNEKLILSEGDSLGLLPYMFWFEVTTKENHTNKEVDTQISTSYMKVKSEESETLDCQKTQQTNSCKMSTEQEALSKKNENNEASYENKNLTSTSSRYGTPEFEKTRRLPLWRYQLFDVSLPKEIIQEDNKMKLPETKVLTVGETEVDNSLTPDGTNVGVEKNVTAELDTSTSPEATSSNQLAIVSESDNTTTGARPICQYEGNCYRQNQKHKDDFSHPGDEDWIPYEQRPMCEFGAKCYRKNERHRVQCRHPPVNAIEDDLMSDSTNDSTNPRLSPQQLSPSPSSTPVPSPLPAKRRCKAVKQNNFIVDDDYESEPEDPFESDGTSDEYLPEESDTD